MNPGHIQSWRNRPTAARKAAIDIGFYLRGARRHSGEEDLAVASGAACVEVPTNDMTQSCVRLVALISMGREDIPWEAGSLQS